RVADTLVLIYPRQVVDRQHMTFCPKDSIWKRWNIRHVNAPADYASALFHCSERCRNKGADGRENDRGIELLGRGLVGAAGPNGTKRARELLSRRIAWPRECVDFTFVFARELM